MKTGENKGQHETTGDKRIMPLEQEFRKASTCSWRTLITATDRQLPVVHQLQTRSTDLIMFRRLELQDAQMGGGVQVEPDEHL
jgi:hypothetical protein